MEPKLKKIARQDFESVREEHFGPEDGKGWPWPWYTKLSFGLVKPRHWAYPNDQKTFAGEVWLPEQTVELALAGSPDAIGVVAHEYGHARHRLDHPPWYTRAAWVDVMSILPFRSEDTWNLRGPAVAWLRNAVQERVEVAA